MPDELVMNRSPLSAPKQSRSHQGTGAEACQEPPFAPKVRSVLLITGRNYDNRSARKRGVFLFRLCASCSCRSDGVSVYQALPRHSMLPIEALARRGAGAVGSAGFSRSREKARSSSHAIH
jgi:hypothetical protein